MQNKKAAINAQMHIKKLTNKLMMRFMKCKKTERELNDVTQEKQKIENQNQEFLQTEYEYRENNNMLYCLMILLLSTIIDYLMLANGLTILCEDANIPQYLKYALPIFLVLFENGISYFASIHYRYDTRNQSIGSKLTPYLVILINLAVSLLAIWYSFRIQDKEMNTVMVFGFGIATSAIQIILFIASALFHYWLIKNSDLIVDMIAYYRFKHKRKKLARQKEALENRLMNKELPSFSIQSRDMVETMHHYNEDFPNDKVSFPQIMPKDLLSAISKVMGWDPFKNNDDDTKNGQNNIESGK